jgi:hypothetical protein
VSTPSDIKLPKHAEASWAALHQVGEDWQIAFAGDEAFQGDQILVSADALGEAGIDPHMDRLVVGYVETRLLAAGYGIAPWDEKPSNATEGWVLR